MRRGTGTLAAAFATVSLCASALYLYQWYPFMECPAAKYSALDDGFCSIYEDFSRWNPPTREDATKAGIRDPKTALLWRAITHRSQCTCFVLIAVAQPDHLRPQAVCVTAPELLRAIASDNHLADDASRWTTAERLALSQPGGIFRFESVSARAFVARRYSDALLDTARALVAALTREQLLHALQPSTSHNDLDDFYLRRQEPDGEEHIRALAHALLEQGLLPRECTWRRRLQGAE